MFITDLVMWRHYNVILENSDITMRPWQRLAISDNLNRLSANVIWNILVLNIKGKINKIAINVYSKDIKLPSMTKDFSDYEYADFSTLVKMCNIDQTQKLYNLVSGSILIV